jgi:hypothetical protein
MAPFLGRRLSVEEIANAASIEVRDPNELAEIRKCAELVRAFQVTPLLGLVYEVAGLEDFSPALNRTLSQHLRGISWDASPRLGPLQKYHILHTSMAAPVDETTGERMALEVFGHLVKDNALDPSMTGRQDGEQPQRVVLPRGELPVGPFAIKVQVATYANVRYPRVGVPFYL